MTDETHDQRDDAATADDSIADRSIGAMLDGEYLRQVKRVGDHLRRFADQIERQGSRITQQGRPRHVIAAADVIHEYQTMVGNMPLWNLLAAADDAQRERTKSSEVSS